MHPKGHPAIGRLSTQLIIAFVVAIIITTIVAGLPAYWLIRDELEHQAWERLGNAERVTLSLFEAEKSNLSSLATLTSQRPTLQLYLREGAIQDLSDYLNKYTAGSELDILIVYDISGQPIANGNSISLNQELPYPIDITYFVGQEVEPKLVLLASKPIYNEIKNELLGSVTVGRILGNEFISQLSVGTGYDQSIIIGGNRIATSLIDSPEFFDEEILKNAKDQNNIEQTEVTYFGTLHYSAYIPLKDINENTIAFSEVSLSVEELIRSERRAAIVLLISTLLIAIIGSIVAGYYANQITLPIARLTTSARKISSGDLNTPVPIPEKPDEIVTLAQAFDESRMNTRRVLEERARTNTWLDTIIQSIGEGIITIDVKGRITSFNQGAAKITGWTSKQVLHKPVNEVLVVKGGAANFIDSISPIGRKCQVNVDSIRGTECVLDIMSTQIISPGDEVQVALVLRDITEEKATEDLRSYFLGNISHEFRTPLSAINASVELLLEEIDDFSLSEIRELLNSIHMSVTGLQTLIDNLLESASIEAGRFHIRRRLIEFDHVVDESLQVMKPLFDRRRQTLSLKEPAKFPTVDADPTRLAQVLVNLLSNASKYSPVEETIELNFKMKDKHIMRAEVADHGPGISPVDREILFQRFVRLGDKDETHYGIGLGLSVVKTIVEEHGGEVGVEDNPGGGSIFWFTIPINGVAK